ncbi:PLP-dependent aminotransferase family protein [Halomonas sp. HMF6819]|uniref:PLP-dependent aminotransferase family protein n=1 Tax=Halomonas sp. HMF6819 TaxID=3373085 RepID=UPI0037B8CB35
MKLILDREGSTPLPRQLETGIVEWIDQHNLASGSRLPSIRQLAGTLGVSRNAVIEAYERLVASGHVRAKPGSGFFVTTPSRDASPFGEITNGLWGLFNQQDEALNLGCGWLPSHWRESSELTYAVRQVTRTDRSALLDYGTPHGSPHLRALLQERLRALAIHVNAQQIVTTASGSHALDLLLRLLVKPGDTVFVESPGYYNLFGLLHLHGVRVVGVPRLADGPDIEHLQTLLETHRPTLFYINSVFHNPTGSTLSPSVAHQLLRLAERHDFKLIEDDIYADFQSTPSTRLASLDGLNRVIYLGSFSKSLSASLRVGFIAAPPALVQPLVSIKMLTSIVGAPFAEAVVALMLENGSYRRLTERLATRLERYMGEAIQLLLHQARWEIFTAPTGGMFVWAKPAGKHRTRLDELARDHDILLSPGQLFYPDQETTPWRRLNVAYMKDARALRFFQAF